MSFDPYPWIPLSCRPESAIRRQLKVYRTDGHETEFEEFRRVRYLKIENGREEKWFSKRRHLIPFIERDGIKLCCPKLRIVWKRFFANGKNGKRGRSPVIFAKDIPPTQMTLKKRTVEISFCPFWGRKLQSLQSEDTNASRARSAAAGRA